LWVRTSRFVSELLARGPAPRPVVDAPPSTKTKTLAGGGYRGARIDLAQLSRWWPSAGSPRADIIRDLPTLRARSRDQMRNAPVALGALNTEVNNVVGTGLSCRPAINGKLLGLSDEQVTAWQDDVAFRFDEWASSRESDAARATDFYGLQELTFRSFLESGDVFVMTPRLERAAGGKRLALQVIEADRCCNPDRKQDTDTLVDGVEIRPETGEAIAYHFAKVHPGEPMSLAVGANSWKRVEARGQTGRRAVLHLMKRLRPDQVRGVPWIAPILEPLKQLQRWTDAELNAAVVSSLMSVFIKMDPDAFDTLFEEDAQDAIVSKATSWSGEIESGKAVNLLPGEEIQTPTPGRPNPEFDPFWQAAVRQIGMALGMPFEVLVMHFQSSYSAARAALLMAWKEWRGRRDFLAKELCQPGYELWLADEVAEGRVQAAGFFTDPVLRAAWCGAEWTGDALGSLDPVKEAEAAEKRIALNISSKDAESIAHDGIPWIVKHRQRVREEQAERADGLAADPLAAEEAQQQRRNDRKQQNNDGQTQALAEIERLQASVLALDRKIDVLMASLARPQVTALNTPP
jgi:lambda family phage portal protein